MLKIHLFIYYFIHFLGMAKFKQACFAHDLSKMLAYCQSDLFSCFSAALGIAQTSLALHSLARKFVRSHTEKISATVKYIR